MVKTVENHAAISKLELQVLDMQSERETLLWEIASLKQQDARSAL